MFSISQNNIIYVNRGDSFSLPISLNVGTAFNPEYVMLGGYDAVYLGVMEPNQPFEVALVRKKISAADIADSATSVVFEFEPKDTVCLLPGKYYYQVKLHAVKDGKDYITTLVDKTLFYIKE